MTTMTADAPSVCRWPAGPLSALVRSLQLAVSSRPIAWLGDTNTHYYVDAAAALFPCLTKMECLRPPGGQMRAVVQLQYEVTVNKPAFRNGRLGRAVIGRRPFGVEREWRAVGGARRPLLRPLGHPDPRYGEWAPTPGCLDPQNGGDVGMPRLFVFVLLCPPVCLSRDVGGP
jgi:hypothetical protein